MISHSDGELPCDLKIYLWNLIMVPFPSQSPNKLNLDNVQKGLLIQENVLLEEENGLH